MEIVFYISLALNVLGVLNAAAKKTPPDFVLFGIPIGKHDQDLIELMMKIGRTSLKVFKVTK